jgi:hypothetical protein
MKAVWKEDYEKVGKVKEPVYQLLAVIGLCLENNAQII